MKNNLDELMKRDVALDDLQHKGEEKVRQANALYETMLDAIAILEQRYIPYAIENPDKSLLWSIPEVANLLEGAAKDYLYHACMHGGQRKKSQRLRGTLELSSLCIVCDNAHQHLPWRKGSRLLSAMEAEYPELFCKRAAKAIAADKRVQELVASLQGPEGMSSANGRCNHGKDIARGTLLTAALCAAHPPPQPEVTGKASLGVQKKVAWNLLPDFKHVYNVNVKFEDMQPYINDKRVVIRDCAVAGVAILRGHKILPKEKG